MGEEADEETYIDRFLDGYDRKEELEGIEELYRGDAAYGRNDSTDVDFSALTPNPERYADTDWTEVDTLLRNPLLDTPYEPTAFDQTTPRQHASSGQGERPRPYRHREPEQDADMRPFDVLETRYNRWRETVPTEPSPPGILWDPAEEAVVGLDVSAEAMYAFTRSRGFEPEDGYLLSRMMEHSSDEVFLLPDMTGVDYLGERNTKTVLIDGDVGDAAGYLMKDGLLCVKGEAGALFGRDMEGGTAIANEGVGEDPGLGMQGGELVVPDPGKVDVLGGGGRVAGLPRDAF